MSNRNRDSNQFTYCFSSVTFTSTIYGMQKNRTWNFSHRIAFVKVVMVKWPGVRNIGPEHLACDVMDSLKILSQISPGIEPLVEISPVHWLSGTC